MTNPGIECEWRLMNHECVLLLGKCDESHTFYVSMEYHVSSTKRAARLELSDINGGLRNRARRHEPAGRGGQARISLMRGPIAK